MPRKERRARGRALLLALACVLCLLATGPSVAAAGTVTRTIEPGLDGTTPVADVFYVYRAERREANRVRVGRPASNRAGVVISDGTATVTPRSPDCVTTSSAEARCVAPISVDGRRVRRVGVLVQTRDGDDRVRTAAGMSGTVDLGSGDDRGLVMGGLTAFGRSGRDILRSGARADLLDGGRDADRLDAGAGDDTLRGGRGADRLFGGAGRDRLDDGPGRDVVFGDSGADRIRATGSRRRVQDVSCGRGRDLVVDPDRFVNVGRDCELVQTARGDRLRARPLRVQGGALVFLAGCAERGCRASTRAGAAVAVRLGVRPPRRGRLLGRRRYRVGLLGARKVLVRLSAAELNLLRAPNGTSLEIHVAGMAYRVLIRVR